MRAPLSFWKSGAVFDPATLALSAWWRAYAGDPQTGIASAGLSGGRQLIDGTAPGVGSLNSLGVATYNGTTQQQSTALNVSDIVTSTAGSMAVLYFATTPPAAAGNGYQDPCFLAMVSRGDLSFSINSTGARAQFVDLTAATVDVTKAASSSAWHLATMRWNTTQLFVGIDGVEAAAGTVAGGGADSSNYATTSFNVGCDWLVSVFLNGKIAEWMASKLTFSATDIANIKSYCNSRYALAL